MGTKARKDYGMIAGLGGQWLDLRRDSSIREWKEKNLNCSESLDNRRLTKPHRRIQMERWCLYLEYNFSDIWNSETKCLNFRQSIVASSFFSNGFS